MCYLLTTPTTIYQEPLDRLLFPVIIAVDDVTSFPKGAMCLTPLFTSVLKRFSCFYKEMMGLIGAGNNPMVGMTVAVAVAIEEASK